MSDVQSMLDEAKEVIDDIYNMAKKNEKDVISSTLIMTSMQFIVETVVKIQSIDNKDHMTMRELIGIQISALTSCIIRLNEVMN